MAANRFNVGEIEVRVLADGSFTVPPTAYFGGTTDAQSEEHQRWMDHDGKLVFPFGCFLVRTAGRTVLIDTGLGEQSMGPATGGALLSELASEGVRPTDIDTVFVTHLHADHVGSCALTFEGALRVTFPNATYRWTSDEQAYWSTPKPEHRFARRDIFEVVTPRWQAADPGSAVAPGVDVVALPGHTPGHAGVVVSSGGERAFILGDAIGCPVQLEEPEWSGLGDLDPRLARKTQEALAREVEGTGALVGASHFPGLAFGRVLRGEGKRYWQPV
jgi:glyoxylase-like metal-dependent hydrolase (beta-lactamase superfamily II)